MSSPYDEQIEALLVEYQDARERAVDARKRIGEVEVTVVAPRRSVKVTVGAQGEVRALDFPTHAYQTMAPKELSKLIVGTLEQARAQALERVMEVGIGPLMRGLSAVDLAQGDIDPLKVVPEELELPEAVRAYLGHELGSAKGRNRE